MNEFFEKLREASTIRGIVILLGLIGYTLTPDQVSDLVALAAVIIYAFYEIFRTDSARKAVIDVMKHIGSAKIIIVLSALSMAFLTTYPVNAQDLCCEAQPRVASYILEIDGGEPKKDLPFDEYDDNGVLWHCFYNVDSMAPGDHTFRAKAVDASGWQSVWSPPFLARRPSPAAGMKIKEK